MRNYVIVNIHLLGVHCCVTNANGCVASNQTEHVARDVRDSVVDSQNLILYSDVVSSKQSKVIPSATPTHVTRYAAFYSNTICGSRLEMYRLKCFAKHFEHIVPIRTARRTYL